jgi:hypothetical protein
MLNQDGKIGSDYKPRQQDREEDDTYCPHCGGRGVPTNHYLYRCQELDCGRYW